MSFFAHNARINWRAGFTFSTKNWDKDSTISACQGVNALLISCSPYFLPNRVFFEKNRINKYGITNCDTMISISSLVSSNMKSDGNFSIFLLTACFNVLVSTPKNSAISLSKITCVSRIVIILFLISSIFISSFPAIFRLQSFSQQ